MRMKKIKNNKGVIIFYLLIIVSAFILKFNNDRTIELEQQTQESIVYNDIFN